MREKEADRNMGGNDAVTKNTIISICRRESLQKKKKNGTEPQWRRSFFWVYLFCGQIITKDPSYIEYETCSVMPSGISVSNRYDGKRYFLNNLVQQQNIAGDRLLFYADFHCDCRSLRRSKQLHRRG